jgi:hypothetical protein
VHPPDFEVGVRVVDMSRDRLLSLAKPVFVVSTPAHWDASANVRIGWIKVCRVRVPFDLGITGSL